jgi:predicted RNA-binding protein with PIN domain
MQTIIIDGSNVVRQIMGYERGLKWKYLREVDNKRSTYFLHCLTRWAYRSQFGDLVRVFFDGAYRAITPRRQRHTLGVEFAVGQSADNLIVREVQALADSGRCEKITVVTADRMLGEIVAAIGAAVMSPEDLEAAISRAGLDLHRFDGDFAAGLGEAYA